MKSLRHYLTESVHTYRYTIKIVGELDKNFLDMFSYNLNKFDPVKIEDPKTTPIQKNPYGFPGAEENQSVTIIKAEFKYPATEPMIQQIAQQLGCNINNVRVMTSDYNDSINAENDKYANQDDSDKPLLTQETLPDNGKEASKDYANQYLDKFFLRNQVLIFHTMQRKHQHLLIIAKKVLTLRVQCPMLSYLLSRRLEQEND